jgi:hypothetical protein
VTTNSHTAELTPHSEAGPVLEIAVELDVPLYDTSYLVLPHVRLSTTLRKNDPNIN